MSIRKHREDLARLHPLADVNYADYADSLAEFYLSFLELEEIADKQARNYGPGVEAAIRNGRFTVSEVEAIIRIVKRYNGEPD